MSTKAVTNVKDKGIIVEEALVERADSEVVPLLLPTITVLTLGVVVHQQGSILPSFFLVSWPLVVSSPSLDTCRKTVTTALSSPGPKTKHCLVILLATDRERERFLREVLINDDPILVLLGAVGGGGGLGHLLGVGIVLGSSHVREVASIEPSDDSHECAGPLFAASQGLPLVGTDDVYPLVCGDMATVEVRSNEVVVFLSRQEASRLLPIHSTLCSLDLLCPSLSLALCGRTLVVPIHAPSHKKKAIIGIHHPSRRGSATEATTTTSRASFGYYDKDFCK